VLFGDPFGSNQKRQEPAMSAPLTTTAKTPHTRARVEGMLRDMGYVLWIAKKLAAEIKAERSEPVRPEMAEFCAVEVGTFVA
jgi:hypothetical protein